MTEVGRKKKKMKFSKFPNSYKNVVFEICNFQVFSGFILALAHLSPISTMFFFA